MVVVRGVREVITGESLVVINKPLREDTVAGEENPNILVVRDRGKTLAVFNIWDFWKKIPDKT